MKKFFVKLWSSIKTGASRTGTYAKRHKVISAIVLLVLVGGGYYAYTVMAAGNVGSQYVLASVSQGPLQVTVTGSGQVSAQDNLNLTPQASGQITEINVKPGQTVKAGTIVAELDMTTAAEAVTSAKQDLESAQISYQQSLSSSNSSVASDQTSVQTAQTSTANAVSTTFTNIAPIMNGFDTALHAISTLPNENAFQNVDAYENLERTSVSEQDHDQVVRDYTAAAAAYQAAQSEYSSVDPTSLDVTQTETLASDSIQKLETINTAIKDTLTYYNYINSQIQQSDVSIQNNQLPTLISNLTNYQTTINGDISNITSANTSLTNAEQSLTNDSQTLGSSGTVPLNVQSAQLNVAKAQEALTQAETNESDYIVRAPFDGVIATVPVNQYDQASSGTTVATLITTEEYADLSLNEADAAKVAVGQPVSMTFDALTGVTMQGAIAEVDPIGTVTQGVVTYDVKIGFNQQNAAIKPGMTVEATIITNSVASAIQVPSAAVHTTGNMSYVEVATLTNASSTLAAAGGSGATGGYGARSSHTASSTGAYAGFAGRSASSTGAYGGYGAGAFGSSTASSTGMALSTAMTTRSLTVPSSEATIKNVPVTVGISSDTMTQITSGLTRGEYVVTATQTAASKNTKSTAASATSLLGGSAAGRTGTGAYGGGTTRSFSGGTGGGFTGGAAAGRGG